MNRSGFEVSLPGLDRIGENGKKQQHNRLTTDEDTGDLQDGEYPQTEVKGYEDSRTNRCRGGTEDPVAENVQNGLPGLFGGVSGGVEHLEATRGIFEDFPDTGDQE